MHQVMKHKPPIDKPLNEKIRTPHELQVPKRKSTTKKTKKTTVTLKTKTAPGDIVADLAPLERRFLSREIDLVYLFTFVCYIWFRVFGGDVQIFCG